MYSLEAVEALLNGASAGTNTWRPVATVALESAGHSDALAAACHTAFSSWRAVLTESLVAAGMDEGAEALALTVLAGIEGGLLLARAAHDETLLRDVGDQLAELIQQKLP